MAALTEQIALARTASPARKTPGGIGDQLFRFASYASAILVLLFLAGILASIAYGGWPAFREFGPGFLTSTAWNIGQEQYGAFVAITDTLASATLALVIGVPISLGIAIYLTQLCPGWARKPVSMTIDLLAAVPARPRTATTVVRGVASRPPAAAVDRSAKLSRNSPMSTRRLSAACGSAIPARAELQQQSA